jgi:hypothetical protein
MTSADLDEAQSLDGEQVGVAGACADERDGSAARGFPSGGASAIWRVGRMRIRRFGAGQVDGAELARFAAGMRGENFAAQFAEILKPGAEVFRQLLVDFAAQALGDGGAFAGGGDGDLQIAAADHGAEEEIAVGNVVDAVAQDAALDASR